MTGAEEWRHADSLDSIASGSKKLYLNSDNGQAGDVFRSGSLAAEQSENTMPDHYRYDPLDTRSGTLELAQPYEDFITDQRHDLNLYGNGLVYHTEPLSKAVELGGFVKFSAWIELDVPDTDFHITLAEITGSGQHILLTQQLLRARYRQSLREAELVVPGDVNHYLFDRFRFFSRRIAQDSRLRLVIRAPNSIHYEKNYNSGGVVAQESGRDARVAEVSLYHDRQYPSYLELPVVG